MITDKKTAKLSYYGMCLAIALILSYVEAMIPINLGVPGAKLGLPNIVTVLLLYTVGGSAACLIGLLRIVLNGFLFGNLFAIAYSAAGFALSFIAMLMLRKTDKFGITGVSAVGGVMHNAGQLIVAALLTNGSVFAYLPVLVIVGAVSGVVIGVVGGLITERVRMLFNRLR